MQNVVEDPGLQCFTKASEPYTLAKTAAVTTSLACIKCALLLVEIARTILFFITKVVIDRGYRPNDQISTSSLRTHSALDQPALSCKRGKAAESSLGHCISFQVHGNCAAHACMPGQSMEAGLQPSIAGRPYWPHRD